MSNYSPLQRNTLDGFSEAAGFLYLKLCDVFQAHNGGEQRAFKAACMYEARCAGVIDYILRNAPLGINQETISALSQFFAERWRHNFMGDV